MTLTEPIARSRLMNVALAPGREWVGPANRKQIAGVLLQLLHVFVAATVGLPHVHEQVGGVQPEEEVVHQLRVHAERFAMENPDRARPRDRDEAGGVHAVLCRDGHR